MKLFTTFCFLLLSLLSFEKVFATEPKIGTLSQLHALLNVFPEQNLQHTAIFFDLDQTLIVDNVPIYGVEETQSVLKALSQRGALLLVLTHNGSPLHPPWRLNFLEGTFDNLFLPQKPVGWSLDSLEDFPTVQSIYMDYSSPLNPFVKGPLYHACYIGPFILGFNCEQLRHRTVGGTRASKGETALSAIQLYNSLSHPSRTIQTAYLVDDLSQNLGNFVKVLTQNHIQANGIQLVHENTPFRLKAPGIIARPFPTYGQGAK